MFCQKDSVKNGRSNEQTHDWVLKWIVVPVVPIINLNALNVFKRCEGDTIDFVRGFLKRTFFKEFDI